jgi:signal transduction histidine kinase
VRDVTILDIAWAVTLSGFGFLLAVGFGQPHTSSEGVVAAVGVLVMTAPVALARRYPLPVAATLAAGAAINGFLIGPAVRCGAALPAVFYVAFIVGSRCADRRQVAAGAALVATNVVCQAVTDPQLGANVIPYMVPIAWVFLAAGRLLHSRNILVRRLQERTQELQAQRDQTAQLAVAADQAQIAEDLEGFLRERVREMAAAAESGRSAVDSAPGEAITCFVEIQERGRQTLTHMRAVVTDLRGTVLTEPQPVLAQLDRLLAHGTQARTRLRITGDPRLLPPGVELSGYRIVEHLLSAVDDDPGSHVDVTVAFSADALGLSVAGPAGRQVDARPALAAAAQRAELLGGTVRARTTAGRCEAVARLPLVGRHA